LEGLTHDSLFIPSCPDLTGLTGAGDRSDRCQVPVGFVSGESLDVCSFGLWCSWLVLGRFQVGLLGFVEVLATVPGVFRRRFVPRPRGVTEDSWNVSVHLL
jgi:hypothetical protein